MGVKKIYDAWMGRRLYLKIHDKLHFGDADIILFFPEDKDDEIETALSCVPLYMEKKSRDYAFCIWTSVEHSRTWVKESIVLSGKQSRLLLAFYDLYNFNRYFIVVSLHLPLGRLAYRLEGFKGLTKEDLYRYQVFYL